MEPSPRTGNLPEQVTSFVGRRREVAELRGALREHRLLTVLGAGGAGKTRLALEAAHLAMRSFAGGTWFVDLGRQPARRAIVDHVASVLGLARESGQWTVDELAARLHDRDALLILDNCEHVVDEVAELARGLLQATSGVVLLATSRQALGVQGERLLQLEGLSFPAGDDVTTAELAGFESAALFVDRGRAIMPTFDLTAENAQAVANIARRLDGLPLAIELAAARLRVLSPQQISSRLGNQFRLLASSRSVDERHHTLRATIEWSYDLCSPAERLCWARLAVFPADFEIEAAEAVASGGEIDSDAVLELLGALIDKSVLRSTPGSDGSTRYRFSEPVRDFGRDRLAAIEPNGAARSRHLDHYGHLAVAVPELLFGPAQVDRISAFRAERPNLEAALEAAVEEDDADAADMLACAIALVAFAAGALSESAEAVSMAGSRDGARSTARVRLLWLDAWVAINQGDLDRARKQASACRRLAQLIDDQGGVVNASQYLGEIELLSGNVAAGERDCRRAVSAARTLGEDHLMATSLVRYAEALHARGDLGGARAALEESIAISDRVGEMWCRGFAQWHLALVMRAMGRPEETLASARTALTSKDMFQDLVGVAQSLELMAWSAADLGELRRAAVLLGAAESLWTSTGAVLPGPLVTSREECEARIVAALGVTDYQALRGAGRALDPEDAMSWSPASTPKSVVRSLASARADTVGTQPVTATGVSLLTARETEVALLVAEGLKNREIAERLVISIRTAELHVNHILTKLGFTSRAQISTWAAHQGIRG